VWDTFFWCPIPNTRAHTHYARYGTLFSGVPYLKRVNYFLHGVSTALFSTFDKWILLQVISITYTIAAITNKQSFFNEGNYVYFLQKARKYITPHCEILSYVLMPNHFHFLIYADKRTEKQLSELRITKNILSENIRLLLSSYTKGINKQEGKTGNLIQQGTKSKCVYDASSICEKGYAATCFYYIHQNPHAAGIVNNMEDWRYSSCRDYAGLRSGTLCNQNLAREMLDIQTNEIILKKMLEEEYLKNIW
jgi:putative transposase